MSGSGDIGELAAPEIRDLNMLWGIGSQAEKVRAPCFRGETYIPSPSTYSSASFTCIVERNIRKWRNLSDAGERVDFFHHPPVHIICEAGVNRKRPTEYLRRSRSTIYKK